MEIQARTKRTFYKQLVQRDKLLLTTRAALDTRSMLSDWDPFYSFASNIDK